MNRYRKSEILLDQALNTIPLGSQTFSKSLTQFPRGVSPFFIQKGDGCRVWDVDGHEYLDFVNALLCVSIGYGDSDITKAVCEQISSGVSFSLPHPLEVEVAEGLVDLVPCAEMVRFGKNGSDATSAAIRLARAHTGKDIVLVCGYHGWHDWYIGSTARGLGVPEEVQKLTKVFKYNDIGSLESLFIEFSGRVAAVILEPMNVEYPKDGFLDKVKKLTHDNGAVLIFDETITGCRFAPGGAQELFGVTPDLATLGKGLANGFPLSAVVGSRNIMSRMEDIFFSGTFGGETASLAAARVVIEKVRNQGVTEYLSDVGSYLIERVGPIIKSTGCSDIFTLSGHPSWSFLLISDVNPYSSWEIKTLFMQEMQKRGVLTIGTHNMSFSHTHADVDELVSVYSEVFPILSDAIKNNSLRDALECATLVPLFRVR